jgi:hypothetical protein
MVIWKQSITVLLLTGLCVIFVIFVLFGSLINKGPWDVVNTKAFTIE